jgi:hypothetical protein
VASGGAVFHCGCFGANIDNDANCFLWPGILCGSEKNKNITNLEMVVCAFNERENNLIPIPSGY